MCQKSPLRRFCPGLAARLPIGARVLALAASLLAALPPVAVAFAADPTAEREAAVLLAREGRHAEAIEQLQRLRAAHPGAKPVAWDLAVIQHWAGRDAESVETLRAVGFGDAPDYALMAAARAARNTRDYRAAEALLALGARRFPAQRDFRTLRALVLIDMDRRAEAEAELERLGRAAPRDAEVWLARAYLAEAGGDAFRALQAYQRALDVAPGNRTALRGRILALADLGAPTQAKALAEASPDLLDDGERQRVAGARAAAWVRYGHLPVADPARRFDATDKALALLEAQRAGLTGESLRRNRYDTLVALRDRGRMAEAIALYEMLVAEGAEPPAYARSAAAAYLYERRPEEGLALYESVLAENPRDFDARFGRFYALVDLERHRDAYAEVDAIVDDEAIWVTYTDSPAQNDNPRRLTADVTAGMARFYGNQLGEAWDRIAPLRAGAPANAWLQESAAEVALARDWPYRSLALARKARTLDPEGAGPALREANALFALQDYAAAGPLFATLHEARPEDQGVRRAWRDWQSHNRRELRLGLERARSSGPELDGPSHGLELEVYSQPLDMRWRLKGAFRYDDGEVLEGTAYRRRSAVGVEYRAPGITALAEAAANTGSESGVGALAEIAWRPGDHWTFGAAGELYSRLTPLRAVKNGVTADTLTLNAGYAWDEGRGVAALLRGFDFTDDNERIEASLRGWEKLVDVPHFDLKGELGLFASTSSRQDVPYYSPKQDLTAELTLTAQHLVWRRFDRSFAHELALTGGWYFEKGYDAAPVGGVAYTHRWRYEPDFELEYGIAWRRPVYDGVRETEVDFVLAMNLRF
jgi:biofilm PGA synthesis protein PgaA